MKRLPLFLILFSAVSALAGITGTNLLPVAIYSAGTNASGNFVLPATHQIQPASFTFYHSVTTTNFPTTNILEVTFDGGNTYATVSSYVNSTNTSDTWSLPLQNLNPSYRVRTITATNQILYSQVNWTQ